MGLQPNIFHSVTGGLEILKMKGWKKFYPIENFWLDSVP